MEEFSRIIFETIMLDTCLSYCVLHQDFLMINLLALRYKQLAEECTQITFDWKA